MLKRRADGGRTSIDVALAMSATGENAAVTLIDKAPAADVTFTLPLTNAVAPTTLRWRVSSSTGAGMWGCQTLRSSVSCGDRMLS